MGKIPQGILGGVSGAVGTVVGATVRGVATIRIKPKKSTKPAVQSQIEQRSKFGLVNEFVSHLTDLINLGYQSYVDVMSPTNAAVSAILDNAVIGDYPNYKLDYAKLVLSKGKLSIAENMTVTLADGGNVSFAWDSVADLGENLAEIRANDYSYIEVINETSKKFLSNPHGAIRSTGKQSLRLPVSYAGAKIHIYYVFISPDAKSVSTSNYLGEFTVLA